MPPLGCDSRCASSKQLMRLLQASVSLAKTSGKRFAAASTLNVMTLNARLRKRGGVAGPKTPLAKRRKVAQPIASAGRKTKSSRCGGLGRARAVATLKKRNQHACLQMPASAALLNKGDVQWDGQ